MDGSGYNKLFSNKNTLDSQKLELAECTDVGEHSLQQAVCESMQQQSVSVAARVRSARSVDALVPTESTVRSGAGFALNAGRNGITLG